MSKAEKIVWLVLFALVVAMWLFDTVQNVCKYKEQRRERSETVERRKSLPLPAAVVCNRNPINESALDAKSIGSSTEMIRYLNEITNPLDPSHELQEPSEQDLIAGSALKFQTYLNITGRNRSGLEALLYSCEAIVRSCSLNGVQLSTAKCCAEAEIKPTPHGICTFFKPSSHQNGPGRQNAFRVKLQVNKATFLRQTKPAFYLYLHQSHAHLGFMKKVSYLEPDKAYNVEIELEETRLIPPSCEKFGKMKKKKKKKMREEKRREVKIESCLKEEIEAACECASVLSLWQATSPLSLEMCATNESSESYQCIAFTHSFA